MTQPVTIVSPSANQPKLGQPTLVKVITETLDANQQKIYQVGVADHLFLYSSTGAASALTFSFDDQAAQGILVGQVVQAPLNFRTCQIVNTTAGSVTYTIVISNGVIDFKGFVVSNTVTVTDVAAEASLATIATDIATEIAQSLAIQNNTRSLNGDTGTQVQASGSAVNTTTVIHTVTAAKTMYLTGFTLTAYSDGTAQVVSLDVYNTVPTKIGNLATLKNVSNAGNVSLALTNPLILPAGYAIKLTGATAGESNYATIFGWEQ